MNPLRYFNRIGEGVSHTHETLFETIMNLSLTEIPYQSKRRLSKLNECKRIKEQKLMNQNIITTDLESLYRDLVKEGTNLGTSIERRMEIRKELALIRKQKRTVIKIECCV